MKKISILIAVFALAPALSAVAQDPLGGASKPRPQMKLTNTEKQYKRVHQFALRMIELSRFDEARAVLEKHLLGNPEDPESHFMLGLLHARLDEGEQSVAMLKEAIRFGLPPARIVAGRSNRI